MKTGSGMGRARRPAAAASTYLAAVDPNNPTTPPAPGCVLVSNPQAPAPEPVGVAPAPSVYVPGVDTTSTPYLDPVDPDSYTSPDAQKFYEQNFEQPTYTYSPEGGFMAAARGLVPRIVPAGQTVVDGTCLCVPTSLLVVGGVGLAAYLYLKHSRKTA